MINRSRIFSTNFLLLKMVNKISLGEQNLLEIIYFHRKVFVALERAICDAVLHFYERM